MAAASAASKGRYGYRRIKAAPGTGVSEKAIRRIMAGDGLAAHVPDVAGTVPTRARRLPLSWEPDRLFLFNRKLRF